MKHTSTDLRVRRTIKSIRNAFNTLVLEKDFNDISITELTELAEINRKTFYLHYSSLDDLIQEIEDETAEAILDSLNKEAENLDVAGCIRHFYNYMENADEVERRLLCDPNYHFFYERVTETVLSSNVFSQFYAITKHPELVRAYCVAITAMYRTWTNHGRKQSIDEVVEYAGTLILNGYNAVKLQ